MNTPKILITRLSQLAVIALLAAPVLADDVNIVASFDATGLAAAQEQTHNDQNPFGGWINVAVTNTGTEPWGDFHFQLFQVGADISNIDFLVDAPYTPISSQSPLSWVVDNAAVGATIDLKYYGDPVAPGETANFSVYTDNQDEVSFFGVAFYPTPLPEPAALGALALIALATLRRRA